MYKHSITAFLLLFSAADVSFIRAQEQGAVVRLDPALDDIIAPGAKLEQLTDTPGLGTREGPIWIRKQNYLLYCCLLYTSDAADE